jgi:hypothetical protein
MLDPLLQLLLHLLFVEDEEDKDEAKLLGAGLEGGLVMR